MSIQIDCTVDLEPRSLNVTLLPSSEIAVSWPPPGTVNARLVPSPSIDVSYLAASPIEVTLLPSSSFDVALLPPENINVSRGTDVIGPQGPQGPAGPMGPQGPAGTLTAVIWGETPTGAIDGVNKNFTSALPYSPNLVGVFLNGLRQRRTADYLETGSQSFSFVAAPLPGDSLSIDYIQP